MSLPYFGKTHISDIAGRTIRRDGSVIELTKDAILDKVVIRASGLKVRAKNFALPAVAPGTIIEYQWRENRLDQLASRVALPLQGDMPMQEITYHIKPLSSPEFPYHMRLLPFNVNTPSFELERHGYYTFHVSNIPAFRPEPLMPPDDQVTRWVLVTYEPDNMLSPGAKSQDEQLAKLAAYCRRNLKDVNSQDVALENRQRLKKKATSIDVLRVGEGNDYQLNQAFAAMALAEGFDVRVAWIPDRGEFFFDKRVLTTYFMSSHAVAIPVGNSWRFFDLANRNLPTGVLRWQEQGVDALVADAKAAEFVRTPVTPADRSLVAKIGQFTLAADGTLEGDVRELLSGLEAIDFRTRYASETPAEREQALHRTLTSRLETLQITDLKINIPEDPASSAGFTFHVKVPGFAQKTGKRLFFSPAFFEAGLKPRFPESTRTYSVYFHYPYSQMDTVQIQLPSGYELESPDAPGSIKFTPVGEYRVKISVRPDHKLTYERIFAFGTEDKLLFPGESYAQLKRIFDQVHEHDGHLLTLKAQDTVAPSASNGRQ